MKKKRSRGIAAALVGCGLLFLGFLCYYSARWYLSLYGSLDFNAILFTLLSGLGGLEQSILVNFFRQPLSLTIYSTVVMTLLFGVQRRFHLRLVIRKKAVTLMPLKPKQFVFASFLLLCVLAWQAASIVMLPKWVSDLGKVSTLFQEEYVSAEDVNITFPEEKRNLIYIYAESMESTYFSKDIRGKITIIGWDYNNTFDNYFSKLSDEDFFYLNEWYVWLLRDSKFVNQVVAQYHTLRKTILSDAYLENYITQTIEYLGPAIERNYERWGHTFTMEYNQQNKNKFNVLLPLERNPGSYDEAIAQLVDTIKNRGNFLDNNIETLYGYCHKSVNKQFEKQGGY